MTRILPLLAVLALLCASLLAAGSAAASGRAPLDRLSGVEAPAQEGGHGGEDGEGDAPAEEPAADAPDEGGVAFDVVPGTLWTISGIAIGALALGILYLFKRRIGAFPAHPSWVAPITIMQSKDLPDEGTFGDVAPDSHGHH